MPIVAVGYGDHVDTISDMAAHAWTELRRLHVRLPVILVGFSMGGFVAQLMYHQNPAGVYGIVFLSTTYLRPIDLLYPLTRSREEITSKLDRLFGNEPVSASKGSAWVRASPYPDEVRASLGAASMEKHLFAKELGAILSYCLGNVGADILHSLRCPVLVIYGMDDTVIPVTFLSRLEHLVANAASTTVLQFSGAGHSVFLDCPTDFTRALARWVTSMGAC